MLMLSQFINVKNLHFLFFNTYRKVASIISVYNTYKDQLFPNTSNFPFIDNIKSPKGASKRDGLVFATLRYLYKKENM